MTAGSLATQEASLLDLAAREADWSGRFDRLEVWRSRETEGGPYEPLFAGALSPARLPFYAEGVPSLTLVTGRTVPLDGLSLDLLVNEQVDVPVLFHGSLTFTEAAAAISLAGAGELRSYVEASGLLVIETFGTGLMATLRVVGGDAASWLGLDVLEPGSLAFGSSPRLLLLPGQSRYPFIDPNGAASYFYKTRYYDSATGETSPFSLPLPTPAIARLPPELLIWGTLELVDQMGNPVANRAVLVATRHQGTLLGGRAVVNEPVRKLTDVQGRVTFQLVRGLSITVTVAGTALARDVEVPASALLESFDLLDPAYGKDDLFAVQRPNLAYAARRSI